MTNRISKGELLEQLDDYKRIYLNTYHPAEAEVLYIKQIHQEIVALVKKEYTEELIEKWENRGK